MVKFKKKSYDFFFELLPFEILKFDVAILQMQYLKKYKS